MHRFKLIVIFAIFSTRLLNAQHYESIFGNDSTKWNYYTDYLSADLLSTIVFSTNTDTVIDSKNYKIVNSDYHGNFSRFGYLREDTVLGKVWFLNSDFYQEVLFMDMSLNVQDTFKITNSSGVCSTLIVEKVSTQSGSKVIEFKDNSEHLFLEGIGSTCGFFNFLDRGCEHLSELLCVYKDGIQTLSNTDACYKEDWTDINPIPSLGLKIFPNPTTDILLIDFGINNNSYNIISIYDIQGQKLMTKQTTLNSISVDVSDYKTGLYILLINNTITQKIIINGY